MSHLRAALRAWIERELPLAAVPDDSVLEALLAGRGGTIFEHLVSHVVSARNATTIRAQLELQPPWLTPETGDEAEGAKEAKERAEELEREADDVERELEELRTRLSSLSVDEGVDGRLGADERRLREALLCAAVENADEGTALCDDVCEFLQSRFSESTVRNQVTPPREEDVKEVVAAVQEILDEAEQALQTENAVKQRMAAVHAEMEHLCQMRPLEDISTALTRIATQKVVSNNEELGEGAMESSEMFQKRLRQRLQDRYLEIFSESQSADKHDAGKIDITKRGAGVEGNERTVVQEAQETADVLLELDKTLSTLTKGNKQRLTNALAEAKVIDGKLLRPLEALKTAARDAQEKRLEADLRALELAQHADLSSLVRPAREDTSTVIDRDSEKLRDAVIRVQRRAEREGLANDIDALEARARRAQKTRQQVDEMAKVDLLPLLERAMAAAQHASEHTVPAAAAEVRGAAKVNAFVAARTKAE